MADSKKYSNGNQKAEEQEFDPYDNRQLDHPNTSLETLLHVMKGCLGTGVLAMPEAFKYAGVINGTISSVLIGIFNAYCFHILIGAQYVLCKRNKVAVLTYPESMKLAVANGPKFLRILTPYASYITNALLISYQIGSCSVYIIFVSENLKLVINTYTSREISLNLIILLSFIPFYLVSCVKNLRLLAPVSLLGNLVSAVTYGVIVYYASQNLNNFQNLTMFGKLQDYPLFFGTALFSLQSIGVMTTAENNMAKPKDFRKPLGVLHIGMFMITTAYIFLAIIGYCRYGAQIKSSITLNFPAKQPLGQTIRILYSLAIFVSYPINMFVVFQIFWNGLFKERLEKSNTYKKNLIDFLHRLAWVVLTYILAIAVPFLGLVTSFLGNFNVCSLLFIFPAIMDICVYWRPNFWWKSWLFWKDIVVILFGVFAFSVGTYSIMYNLSKNY